MNYRKSLAVELVCKRYCSYYKADQNEEVACQGFEALQDFIERNPESVSLFPTKQDSTFTDQYHNLLHYSLCQHCDFLIDGCDFKDPRHDGQARPCGGYLAANLLLERPSTAEKQLLKSLVPEGAYVKLAPNCVLRHVERPYVYDIKSDELYELDSAGFDFFRKCDGSHLLSELPVDKPFLETCLKEGLLAIGPRTRQQYSNVRPSPIPSLRYLELQLTRRCNLKCRHCYLGEPTKVDMPLSQVLSVLEEFEQIQGLRVLFSGGEPLLYSDMQALSEALPGFGVRKVLLTNGTLVTEESWPNLRHFDEIQFSVDGLKDGHEAIRGQETYGRTLRGIEVARENGMSISIATMVHHYNLKEFDALAKWIEELGITEWNIDVPCAAGRLSENPGFWVRPKEGAAFLQYAAGGSYHGAEEPFACGYHLCTVTAEGDVLKCGFFHSEPLGSLDEGLEVSWKRARPVRVSELECDPCPHLSDCKGGCRFRAESPLGKDPVMCALYGL
jgi:radical SAM protein with 4Fe4S-binding SPASM domain